MNKNLLLHFRPRRVPAAALPLSLTWGLGGMAALLVVQQLFSGLLLGFFYEPLPVRAYESIVHIQNSVFLGQLVRNMHHWTGHALIIVVFLHLLRVFISGALYPPRRGNWLIGLGLAVLVLAANFSGYLLPWDQLSYWAVTIATSMLSYIPIVGIFLQDSIRGGEEVGAATLQIFYSFHTTFIPTALFLFMAYHFWFVRKAGGVLLPAGRKEQAVEGKKQPTVSINKLLVQEISFAAVVTCILLLFSMFFNAPLGDMANPAVTPATVKAPWFFLGAQELLLHLHPLAAVFVLPLSITLFLILLPFMKTRTGRPGPIARVLFFGGTLLLLLLTIIGIWFRGPAMTLVWPW